MVLFELDRRLEHRQLREVEPDMVFLVVMIMLVALLVNEGLHPHFQAMHHVLDVVEEAAVWVTMMRRQRLHVHFVMIFERVGLAPGVSFMSQLLEL